MTFHFSQVLLFTGLLNAGILLLLLPRLPVRDKRPAVYLGVLVTLIALYFVSFGILPRFRRIADWFHLIRIPVAFFIGPVFLLLVKSLQGRGCGIRQQVRTSLHPGAFGHPAHIGYLGVHWES